VSDTDGLDLVRAYNAAKRLLADEREANGHLRESLTSAIRERDAARRCLADHADCDEEDCRVEIEAARGIGPDPQISALLARAERAESALASAELRGAQRQREADVKALRDIADTQSPGWLWFESSESNLFNLADYLSALPLAASPEEEQS
jgi:hypothetical protein